MKRFIVAVHKASPEDQRKVTSFFRRKGFGWWHRIDGFWLVTTKEKDLTSEKLLRQLHSTLMLDKCLVMEISGTSSWAGLRDTSDLEAYSWLTRTWKSGDDQVTHFEDSDVGELLE